MSELLRKLDEIKASRFSIRQLHNYIKDLSNDEIVCVQNAKEIFDSKAFKLEYKYHLLKLFIIINLETYDFKGLDSVIKINNIVLIVS